MPVGLPNHRRWSNLLLGLLLLTAAGNAWAACSVYHGFATINEVHRSGNATRFIEVKLLDGSIPAAEYEQWTVRACGEDGRPCTTDISLAQATSISYPWLVIEKSLLPNRRVVDLSDPMSVILRDADGDTIDFLSVDGENTNRDYSCTPAYDWRAGDTNSHTLRRTPDGTGDWGSAPGNSSNNTEGDTNDNEGGADLPLLALDDVIVAAGDAALFTVTLDQSAANDVRVGYRTVDGSAVAGTDYTASSGTLVIPAGTTSATVSVPTDAASQGGDFHVVLEQPDNASIGDHFGRGSILAPVIYLPMDEPGWDGSANEVTDESGNGYDGTAGGDATTSDLVPRALAGNPGTCGYGVLDGNGDYVLLDDAGDELEDSYTFASWVRLDSVAGQQTVFSAPRSGFWGIAQAGQTLSVDNGDLLYFRYGANFGGGSASFRVPAPLVPGQWHHLAVSHDAAARRVRMFVDGVELGTRSYGPSASPSAFGPLLLATDIGWNWWLGYVARNEMAGAMDEVRLYRAAYDASVIDHLRDLRHPCGGVGLDQLLITHDARGVHCLNEPITVQARAGGAAFTGFQGTVQLNTGTGAGGWQVAPGFNAANLADADPNDGLASYQFDGSEPDATVELRLVYREGANPVQIQASAGGIVGTAADLVFTPSGYVFTDAPVGNPAALDQSLAANTAGTGRTLHITAYGQTPTDPVCGIIESYDGAKALDFWAGYQQPAHAGGAPRRVLVDGRGIDHFEGEGQAGGAWSVSFSQGRAQVPVRYKDTGSVRLHARDTGTPVDTDDVLSGDIRGGSQTWVSRPAELLVNAIRRAVDGVANPAAADADGPAFIAAGEDFLLRVEARDADGDLTPSFGQEGEAVDLEHSLLAPAGGQNPALQDGGSGPLQAFSGGQADSHSLSWGEVGILQMRALIADGDYLGSGSLQGAWSEPVGRFHPASFQVQIEPESGSRVDFAAPAGSFGYLGQGFVFDTPPRVTLRALNADGARTRNYEAAFWKLGDELALGGPARYSYADNAVLTNPSVPGLDSPGAAVAFPDTSAVAGELVLSGVHAGAAFAYQRGNMPLAPFDPDVSLTVALDDGDAQGQATLTPIGFSIDALGAGETGYNDQVDELLRWGRLRVANSYGPETRPQPVPLIAEYWSSQGVFVPNTLDSSTPYDGGQPGMLAGATYLGGLSAAQLGSSGSGVLSSGAAQFSLHDDTDSSAGPGVPGTVVYRLPVPDYLRYDWDDVDGAGDGPQDDDPPARATFGVYGGQEDLLYLREIY
ncbi:DUF6701 domain-containing protein [Alkalilimnicola sp. S0819]|uniref:DUF6701 domain-containing protein n=1 Tax=Alkalilimnicola sp. S0819 TaxID=2613922 RepID=UPI00186A53FD|nr:DUF6701 domain-containing protein [Alkalilimnicola sp. S0819]